MRLTDQDTGSYLVCTETGSRYLLDLDARTVLRVRTEIFGLTHALRRDGEDVHLLELVRCVVGAPMVLLINLFVPNVIATTRTTSVVVGIEQLVFEGPL